MKKLNEDKLDKINRENTLKSNLIKWWNVHMTSPDQREEEEEASTSVDDDAFSEDNTVLYESILKDNSRDEDPFEKAMKQVQEEENQSMEEANKVYARLMEEAQKDEEKKWMEIEEIRRKTENGED